MYVKIVFSNSPKFTYNSTTPVVKGHAKAIIENDIFKFFIKVTFMLQKNILCAVALFTSISCLAKYDIDLLSTPQDSTQTSLVTIGTGISAAIASFYALNSYFEGKPTYITLLAPIAVSGLASWLTYRFLPEGKLERVQDILKKALNDKALNELIEDDQNLLAHINNIYITELFPRVIAYNKFIEYHKALTHAAALLKDTKKKTNKQIFKDIAKKCSKKIKQYLVSIEKCIICIRTSENWLKELDSYNLMLKRKAQEDAAWAAQQAAFNCAFNYCSSHNH